MRTGTPIIVDIDGGGYHLTSAKDGTLFDFFDTGTPVQISWIAKGSTNAFLVRDLNGNGTIDNGKEMFGNLTEQPKSDDPNGFLALEACCDDNHDGWVDASEAKTHGVLLWTVDGKLWPMGKYVERISTHYHKDRHVDQYGNLFRYAAAIDDDTKDHRVYDVILQYVQ